MQGHSNKPIQSSSSTTTSGSISPWVRISPPRSPFEQTDAQGAQTSMNPLNEVRAVTGAEKTVSKDAENSDTTPQCPTTSVPKPTDPQDGHRPDTPSDPSGLKAEATVHHPSRKQRSKKASAISNSKTTHPRHENDYGSSSAETNGADENATSKDFSKAKRVNKAKPPSKKKKAAKTESDIDTDSTSSEDKEGNRKSKARGKAGAKPSKKKKMSKPRRRQIRVDSESSCSDAESESAEDEGKSGRGVKDTSVIDSFIENSFSSRAAAQLTALRLRDVTIEAKGSKKEASTGEAKVEDDVKKGSRSEYMRLDNLWSNKEHRFVMSPTTADQTAGQYDGYAFTVVRHFTSSNKYAHTELSILSKPLKKAMHYVMGNVEAISLEEDTPKVDPNIIFLYLKEFRAYMSELKAKIKDKKNKSKVEQLKLTREHIKVLVKYLDKDYDEVKKSLYPLLKAGKITWDLAWALFKPNDIVYTTTYEHEQEPKAVQVELVTKEKSIVEGEYYRIQCRFLDHNGTRFGMSKNFDEIKAFKGPRHITSLLIYPIKYHKDAKKLKEDLIERGKKFVALEGMKYRFQKGIAFHKRDRKVIKVHVNGRVMLDPTTFRRLRPNYPFASVQPMEKDLVEDSESDADTENINESSCSSSDDASQSDPLKEETQRQSAKRLKKWKETHKRKLIQHSSDEDLYHTAIVDISATAPEELEDVPPKEDDKPEFTDEEYLIASPVVLGFSFSEKLWLEFAVSGIRDIEWNEGAFDSLIIPDDQKTVVKALVESHAFEAKKNIDDVIQGKGRGLVAVLHGPPGTGKTLTAEGIAELLKKPLYAVSVGELGIRGGDVERNLTQILDVAHTWDALLLLDEADVFLEERTNYDVGRNSLVSIFLRMLEYFQGILFLTTNRVSCFDPAFASRIHVGLRYGELGVKAKKQVWRIFIEKVRALPDVEVEEIKEEDYKRLANFELNGREIKNAVRTAQSVALIKKENLGMQHFLQVLLVGSVFAKDLKGAGYEEAMKFYM